MNFFFGSENQTPEPPDCHSPGREQGGGSMETQEPRLEPTATWDQSVAGNGLIEYAKHHNTLIPNNQIKYALEVNPW